jgi:hypothetical protein
MRYSDVAANVQALVKDSPARENFVYDFLLAYGTPKASIARLKSGQMNLAKLGGELLFKKKFYFKAATGDLFAALEALKTVKGTKTNDPRFLFVTDFQQVVAFDRKTSDSLTCELSELDSHFDFFLPLAGMEKQKLSNENPADIKAAERMAKLFDAIKAHNPDFIERNPHAMNVFLARLLFCFFAEDTGIFEENAVSNSIASHTAADASDLHDFFVKLFDLLDRKSRDGLPKHLRNFPYVNGGLFRDHYPIPEFSMKARRMMIEAGELNWSDINPDIFGSMFQAVIDPEERHNLGQHYTSVTNIMKVIEPLFLNDFREAFDKACALQRGKAPALHRLLDRIAKVKIFDPACGSGNFLIIAYKELRRLEMDIFSELQKDTGELPLSSLKVSQFYGIEISDFAAETAVLALWLTEHQMNLESKKVCGQAPDNLPLKEGAKIVCANACRIDWEDVCPKEADDEIYILGNPPYLGARVQSKSHKADMTAVFGKLKGANSLDYITCWFQKASKYIRGINASYAFVSTNSICQGEQVAMIWPLLLGDDLEINFAYKSFKWTNSAKGNAGVTCIVVGVAALGKLQKYLYSGIHRNEVSCINPYLVEAPNIYVDRRSRPLSDMPLMKIGNKPIDGGNYLFSSSEKETFIIKEPQSKLYFRRWYGYKELIQGLERWCLFVQSIPAHELENMPATQQRIENVKLLRMESKSPPTQELGKVPTRFHVENFPKSTFIVVPKVSSERRAYIPVTFLSERDLASDLLNVVDTSTPEHFGLLTSRMHMTWVRAVAGRLKTDYRYSAGLCYNTFPVPNLNEPQKQTLTEHVMEVLQQRENHPEKTMAQLYDPDKMPAGLRAAHQALDRAVDRLYRKAPFSSDEERLEHLFKSYEAMIAAEQKGKK